MIKLHRFTLLAILLGIVVLALTSKGTWAAPEREFQAQTVPSPTPNVTDTPLPTATTEPPTATTEPGSATATPAAPTATSVGTAISPAHLTQTAQAAQATPARLPASGGASGAWLTVGALLLLLAGGLLLGLSLVSRRLG